MLALNAEETWVANQLQTFLDETDFLCLFHSVFRPRFGTEIILVTLVCYLYFRGEKRIGVSVLIHQYLSMAFEIIAIASERSICHSQRLTPKIR